jgi:hypothetical protein
VNAVNESMTPQINDLSDEDMVSRRRDKPHSLIAATGIEFEGLERLEPVPAQQWIDRVGTRVVQD